MNKKIILSFIVSLFLISFIYAFTLTTFSDDSSIGNITFTKDQNITKYLKISVDANVTSAYMNLTGYEGWITELLSTTSEKYVGATLDSNDYSHICYIDSTNHRLEYIYWNGTEWKNETVVNNYAYRDCDIKVDSNDKVHIVHHWFDGSRPSYWLYYCNGTVGDWDCVELWKNIDQDDFADDINIEIDSNNYPHITEPDSGNKLLYFWQNASGWNNETILTYDAGDGSPAPFKLNGSGYPRLINVNETSGADGPLLYFKKLGDGTWDKQTIESGEVYNRYTSLALNDSDYPQVTYTNSTSYLLKYAKWDGSSWNTEYVDSTVALHNELDIDSNNNPHIFYYAGSPNKCNYTYNDGTNWITESISGACTFLDAISLNLDSNDYARMVFNSYGVGYVWYSNLTNPWIEIGTVDGTREWNFTGTFSQTDNQTEDLSSVINTALNNGACDCTGCSLNFPNCLVPYLFHSDVAGNLEYSAKNVSWNDVRTPTWQSNKTNTTSEHPKINESIQMNVTLMDGYSLSGYIFSWNGTTNGWKNDSLVDISGETNITIIINKTINISHYIAWTVYFNDTSDNKNQTDIFTFEVINTIPTIILTITPAPAGPTDDLNGIITFTDADSDTWTYNDTRWYNNSKLVTTGNNQTLLGKNNFSDNDIIIFSARSYDGYNWSIWVNSSPITIGDITPPDIFNITFSATSFYSDVNMNVTINCTDIGSSISFARMEINSSGALTNYTMTSASGDIYYKAQTYGVGTYTVTNFYCKDTSGNLNTTSSNQVLTVTARPSGVIILGDGGGGVEEAKLKCNITIEPQNLTFFIDDNVLQLFIINNADFSITPTYAVNPDNFEVLGASDIIHAGIKEEITILRNFVGNESINDTLKISFVKCKTEIIELNFNSTKRPGIVVTLKKIGNSIITTLTKNINLGLFTTPFYFLTLITVVIVFIGLGWLKRLSVKSRVASGIFLILFVNILLGFTIPTAQASLNGDESIISNTISNVKGGIDKINEILSSSIFGNIPFFYISLAVFLISLGILFRIDRFSYLINLLLALLTMIILTIIIYSIIKMFGG